MACSSVFTGPNDSLMERLQQRFPSARFVMAFNSVGNAVMVNPTLPGGPPTMFYCGNDAGAKRVVADLLVKLGWQPADMAPPWRRAPSNRSASSGAFQAFVSNAGRMLSN